MIKSSPDGVMQLAVSKPLQPRKQGNADSSQQNEENDRPINIVIA